MAAWQSIGTIGPRFCSDGFGLVQSLPEESDKHGGVAIYWNEEVQKVYKYDVTKL